MIGHRLKLPDGSSWPRPAMERDEENGPAWVARYCPTHLTREDLLELAAVADAYGHLVTTPSAARALPKLRQALRDELKAGDPCSKQYPEVGHEDEGYSCSTHNMPWGECNQSDGVRG